MDMEMKQGPCGLRGRVIAIKDGRELLLDLFAAMTEIAVAWDEQAAHDQLVVSRESCQAVAQSIMYSAEDEDFRLDVQDMMHTCFEDMQLGTEEGQPCLMWYGASYRLISREQSDGSGQEA
jgi:hypothetical protein